MNEDRAIVRRGAFVATTEPWLGQIYRLRHRRFVVEQGKSYPGVSPDGTLVDAEDQRSRQIAYCEDGRLVAALRQTALQDVSPEGYLADLAVHARLLCAPETIVCSRFVTDEGGRSLRAVIALFRLAYQIGLDLNVRHSVLSTREELVSLFETFGYRQTGGSFEHPVAGTQIIMLLDLRDTDHLDRIGSPLARLASRKIAGEVLS